MKNQVIFLVNKFDPELEGKYFAIYSDRIENLNISDTYDRWGQSISSYDAGDYVEITDVEKFKLLHRDLYDSLTLTKDDVLFDGDSDVFHELEQIEEGEYFIFHRSVCKGFNYWNGNNWRTVLVECDGVEPEWEILQDKSIIKRLRTALTKKKELHKGFGTVEYQHGKVFIVESFYQNRWENYTLEIGE